MNKRTSKKSAKLENAPTSPNTATPAPNATDEPKPTPAEVVEVVKLPDQAPSTETKEVALERCELVYESHQNSFRYCCEAMYEISIKHLYKAKYKTFKNYCNKRWGFSRSYGYALVKAHQTIAKVSTKTDTFETITNGSQAKALAKVPEKLRAEVVKNAAKSAGNKKLTGRHIKECSEAIQEELNDTNLVELPKEAAASFNEAVTIPEPTTIPMPHHSPAEGMVWVQLPASYYENIKNLPSLQELSKDAIEADNLRSNPSRKTDYERLSMKLKTWLPIYAEWERECLLITKEQQKAA